MLIGGLWLRGQRPQRCAGTAMGCQWILLWRGAVGEEREVAIEVQQCLDHWERVMSTWRSDSDLSRYNQGAPATADLIRVLAVAEEIHKSSDGAFDPYLLEASHAAGFAPEGKGLDLSGIGKGFAVDRVAERLRARGMKDFLFQLAGETIAGDRAWDVGIESPDPHGQGVIRQQVRLQNQALATSGNYRQFRETEAGVITHIIDPKTRKPVVRGFSSVTIIAADCTHADAWATAMFVKGTGQAPTGMKAIWQP